MRPHSIAARRCNKAKGDVDQMRVELRPLMEAASESNDEQEQGAALLLAGVPALRRRGPERRGAAAVERGDGG